MADATDGATFLDEAWRALTSGDADQIARYWSLDLTWYGLHRSGEQREYQGVAGLLQAMAEPPQVAVSLGEEPLETWSIGNGVIAARILGRRRATRTGEEITSEFLFAVRVEQGVITRVVDLVDAELASFWRRATDAW